jgi:putative thioredoxin
MPAAVKDVTVATFQAEVMERSQQLLVIVDFWAPWCGPCKTLGPTLEAAVAQHPGKVELAKINCDTEPQLAAAFGITGIPAVKAIRNGQLLNEFTGAQPAHIVDAWLRSLLPSAEEETLAKAKQEVAQGDREGAIEDLQAFLKEHPGDAPVLLQLGRQLSIAGRNVEALQALNQIPDGAPEAEQASQEKLLIAMLASAESAGGLAGALRRAGDAPDDPEARFALAGARWIGGDHDGAIGELLELFRTHRSFRDDGARRTLLAVFEHLGAEHSATIEGRHKLAMLLFA